jgi:hypothetical protein
MAKRSAKGGEVDLNWKAVAHGKAYQVEMTTTDPADLNAEWTVALVSSKSRVSVKNLTRGTMYWFRVKAISGDLTSPYSNVELVMAA